MSKKGPYTVPTQTWGPIAFLDDETKKFTITCRLGSRSCTWYAMGKCHDERQTRVIDDPNNTPDWCQHKADMVRDIEKENV
jgi:hypothetical protein